MALDNYDPSSSLTVYYPNRVGRRMARVWSVEKLAHDLASIGIIDLFKGPGTDPTTLDGYANTKMWLQVSSGVTQAPGVLRIYDGAGSESSLANWPVVTPAMFASYLTSGQVEYQGAWNAATNTPPLVSGSGTKGWYYVVSVAGATSLDGNAIWAAGDWVIYNGSMWQKVDNASQNVLALPEDTANSDDVDFLLAYKTSAAAHRKVKPKNIGFTQAGTGAALRTLQSKLRETVSVTDFGAVGDGVSSDSSAINAAIAAANGGRVVVPPGTYMITAPIVLATSDVELVGEYGAVIKRGFSGNCIRVEGDDVKVIGLEVDGNKASFPSGGGSGVLVLGSRNTVSDCDVKNCPGHGVILDGQSTTCNHNVVSDCYVHDNTLIGIGHHAASYSRISNNWSYGNGAEGITLDLASSYAVVSGNIVEGNTGGVGGIGIDDASHITITGNLVSANTVSGVTAQGNVGNSRYVTISGNTIANNGTYGVVGVGGVGKLIDSTVIGNTFAGNATGAIILGVGCDRNVISSNNTTGQFISNSGSSNVISNVEAGVLRGFQTARTTAPSGSAAWLWRADTLGVANESGLYQDASNNIELALRDSTGALKTRIGSSGNSYINTSGSVQVGSLEIGHATDTTLQRVAAGRISVEGSELATLPELASTANGLGAALIGIEDALSYFSGVTVESALQYLGGAVAALDQAVVLKGTWDASGGTFPGAGAAQAGWSYIVSVGGTVDGVSFSAGDRIIAIADNASATTFASNWFKSDYTDAVSSVAGRTGAVSLSQADISGLTTGSAPQFAGATLTGSLNATGSAQILSDITANAGYIGTTYRADSTGNRFVLRKSRNASVAGNTVVQSGDEIGSFVWRGADGANWPDAASVSAEVDGTPGTNDMPGRLLFKTTADGASAASERARIDNKGNIVCNTAAIATTATDGFLYVPGCAGTPTGTPTSYSGRAPLVVDTTNNKLYFYSNGAWRDASL